MNFEDKNTQTNTSLCFLRYFCVLKVNDILKFISSLLIPLALGIFTVVVTFQQQNLARQQRDEDRYAAEQQRSLETYLSDERYKNDIVDDYIKELTVIFQNNGVILSNPTMYTIVRVKTLNIFRQLDSQRNTRILRFLYEAKQLMQINEQPPLDLSTAELRDIDFRDSAIDEKKLYDFSLTGVFLLNATFMNIEMRRNNFSDTRFDTVNFGSLQFNRVTFTSARFINSNFSLTQLNDVDFSLVYFRHVNLSLTSFFNVNCSLTQYEDIVFFKSLFFNVNYTSARFENVNFSFSLSNNISFLSALLFNIDFSNLQFNNVQSPLATFFNVSLSSAKLHYVDFSRCQFNNTDFSLAILISADFSHTQMSYMHFQQTHLVGAKFDFATLSNFDFLHANLKYASFTNVDIRNVSFSYANLYKANFLDTNLVEDQLRSALSIHGARLPNGTFIRDENLIRNGDADCNLSMMKSWILVNGTIAIVPSKNSTNNCLFELQSYDTGAIMLQYINFIKWNSRYWPYSRAVLTAKMGEGVSIKLRSINKRGIISVEENLNFHEENITMILYDDVRELHVIVEFDSVISRNTIFSRWCDDIYLFILYGTYSELLHINLNVPTHAQWTQNGSTVVGRYDQNRNSSNRLTLPWGLHIDDSDSTLLIADWGNDRVIEKKLNEPNDQILIHKDENENNTHRLHRPVDLVVDRETNSIIVCSVWNKAVIQWFREKYINSSEPILTNIDCWGLMMDEKRFLYVSDTKNSQVKRYRIRDTHGQIVAGGHGTGSRLDQLNWPTYIFIDRDHSIYVSDHNNNRIMKWAQGATEGIVVVGGRGQGTSLVQLSTPLGLYVDSLETIYVVEQLNHRVTRWIKGARQGEIIIGKSGQGSGKDQLSSPTDLSFDRFGHLYVVDNENHRVQRFSILTN